MLYMSQATISRRARLRAWAHRPFLGIDSPVKRYLGNPGSRTNTRQSRPQIGRLMVRPAT